MIYNLNLSQQDTTVALIIGGFITIILITCAMLFMFYNKNNEMDEEELNKTETKNETQVQETVNQSAILNQTQNTENKEKTDDKEITDNKEVKIVYKTNPWLKALLIIILIIISIFAIVKIGECISSKNLNNDGTLNVTSRSANNSDISIDLSTEFSFNMNYELIPRTDIKNLQLTFTFMDSNKNTITTKTKNIGNVNEGTKYTVSISLTEFSLTEIFSIQYAKCNVTGGTVSYF